METMTPHEERQFLDTNFAEFRRLFLAPELSRRGLPTEYEVAAAVVELRPKAASPRVLLDTEVQIKLFAVAGSPVQSGDPVTLETVKDIESAVPIGLHPDSGWWLIIDLPYLRMSAFDFRRNRGQAQREVERAQQFVKVAELALERDLVAVAAENLFAAAELAAVAQLRLHRDDVPRRHADRRRTWRNWTELGNAPAEHSMALARLAGLRASARYAGPGPRLDTRALRTELETVTEMVAFARVQISARYDAA